MSLKMYKTALLLFLISVMMAGCKKKELNIIPIDLSSCEMIKKQGTEDQTLLKGNWELEYVQKSKKNETADYIYYLRIFDKSFWSFMTFRKVSDGYMGGNAMMVFDVTYNRNSIFFKDAMITLVGIPLEQSQKEKKYHSRVLKATCFSVNEDRLFLFCEGDEGSECFVYKRDTENKYDN